MSAQAYGLLDTLKRVQLTGHQRYGSVEIFHLRWPGSNGLDYVTLDESLEAGWIEITEFTEAGQVPRIKIINRSQHMVFLMAGEQVVGCKQNRVVNASMMVPAHSEMPLPVTCVERGRWGYSGPVFTSPHSSSHHQLRVMMAAQAARSYRRTGVPSADQAAVWREVSRKLGTMGSRSSSDALQDMFRDNDKKLKEALEQLPAPTDCNGAVFVIGGRIAGADVFDNPETLRKLWPKLIKSCTIDALEPSTQNPGSTTPEEITSWRGARARRKSRFRRPESGRTCASKVKMYSAPVWWSMITPSTWNCFAAPRRCRHSRVHGSTPTRNSQGGPKAAPTPVAGPEVGCVACFLRTHPQREIKKKTHLQEMGSSNQPPSWPLLATCSLESPRKHGRRARRRSTSGRAGLWARATNLNLFEGGCACVRRRSRSPVRSPAR